MNIKQRIWFGFFGLILLFATGSLINLEKSRTANAATKRLTNINLTEQNAAKSCGQDMERASLHSLQFQLQKKTAYAESTLKDVEDAITEIGIIAKTTAAPERKAQAEHALTLAKDYADAFKKVENLRIRRGLTPDTGLEGELRAAVHKVEAKAKECNDPELMIAMLTCRRHEKDYLLRGDISYVTQAGQAIKAFETRMATLTAPEAWKSDMRQLWDEYQDALQALAEGDDASRNALAECDEKCSQLLAEVEQMETASTRDLQASSAEVRSELALNKTITLLILLAGCAAGAFFSILIVRSIMKIMTGITRSLDESATQLHSASTQVASASQTLANASSQQASSLEETSASLEELSSMTRNNADNSRDAREAAAKARQYSEEGSSQMKEMVGAMEAINTASQDISKILRTIDEIAFQTNILALNAAVEAARAGEAGAGFAVVADEVRNLAQRAAEAARETAVKIEDSSAKSQRGTNISTEAARSFETIHEQILRLDALATEIASASFEQSKGIEQVTATISQMDSVTQANASSAEETASASEELNSQAEGLSDIILSLQDILGARESPQSETPPRNRLTLPQGPDHRSAYKHLLRS